MLIDDQSALISALSDPAIYGLKTSRKIVVKRTNISVVFLTGDRAFKLKLGVKFPYVDYSTPEKRKIACEKELELCNRWTAGFGIAVRPVVKTKKGYAIGPDKQGEVVDWLLEMIEFPEDMLFDKMIERGELDRFEMMDTAEKILSMQRQAAVVKERDPAAIIRGRIDENNAMIRCFVPEYFDAEEVDALEKEQIDTLERVKNVLKKRGDEGKIRVCHGDLTLRNIAMRDGKVTIFNPIEFYDDLTRIDTLYDFAFLLVDMESKGQRRLASILFNHYLAASDDWDGVPALPLFMSCRAAVNAYVFAEQAAGMTDKVEATLMANRAYAHLVLARRYLIPKKPLLMACGGLSGSGKSRIGRETAPFVGDPPGAVILRDDVLRKNILGVGLEEHIDTASYTPELEQKVFDELCERCLQLLKAGQSVVADALFHDPKQRMEIERVAREAQADFLGLWVDAPLEVRKERVMKRLRNPSDVKTAEELEKQLTIDVGPITWNVIDSSGDRMVTLSKVRSLLSAV